MLATFYASNAVAVRLCWILRLIFLPQITKNQLQLLLIKLNSFSLFKAYHILIYQKAMARIFMSVPFLFYCAFLSSAFSAIHAIRSLFSIF